MEQTILITGGAGYIGSHVSRMLQERGFLTVVFDNLSTGRREAVAAGDFIKGDLRNRQDIEEVFQRYAIDAVMHFAASIAVGESCVDPNSYYVNNVIGTINLLDSMVHHDVGVLIFSSSAAVYGVPTNGMVTEKASFAPINPYGRSKAIVEEMLPDYDRAYGLRYCALRYFNAAGGDPHLRAKNYNTHATNVIPILFQCATDLSQTFSLYGTDYDTPDGTCIRDYIHIDDLGLGHICACERLFAGALSGSYNLGNGRGVSVREIIRSTENITGATIDTIDAPRRAGDPPSLIADATKARQELAWAPRYTDIESIIYHQWKAVQ